uniref:Uncharacterized protein n=1 Tax=viral metagenome TaxID=1070528 RepID=A0A6C0DQG2_9ZZZZ
MSGTLDLPPKGFFTPPRQKIPSPTTPGTSYSPAEKLKIRTPDLLKQAKDAQALEEVPKKGGKSRRRKGSKKARKTRRRKSRK